MDDHTDELRQLAAALDEAQREINLAREQSTKPEHLETPATAMSTCLLGPASAWSYVRKGSKNTPTDWQVSRRSTGKTVLGEN